MECSLHPINVLILTLFIFCSRTGTMTSRVVFFIDTNTICGTLALNVIFGMTSFKNVRYLNRLLQRVMIPVVYLIILLVVSIHKTFNRSIFFQIDTDLKFFDNADLLHKKSEKHKISTGLVVIALLVITLLGTHANVFLFVKFHNNCPFLFISAIDFNTWLHVGQKFSTTLMYSSK